MADLISRAELKEKVLLYRANNEQSSLVDKIDVLEDMETIIDLAPAVEAGLKWIPVTERLPEKHGSVYVCLLKFPKAKEPFPYCLAWHAYGSNGYVNGPHFSDEGLDGMKVTHWMPLPALPKD